MKRSCVPAASTLLLLASALPASTFAQTSFFPKYIPFQDTGGLINSGMPLLQQDFNSDGIPDFMNGEYPTVEMLSTGAGNYKVTSDGGGAVASGDFNNDGKADYLMYVGADTLYMAYGTGKGTFTQGQVPELPGLPTNGPATILGQATDVNGDGRPDLLLLYYNSSTSNVSLRLWLNNGGGFTDKGSVYSFPVASGLSLGGINENFDYTAPYDLVLGDYDSDGHADVAVRILTENIGGANAPSGATLVILYGNGKGAFTSKTVFLNRGDEPLFAAADMNDDGRTDLVATDDQSLHYFISNPGRTFSESVVSTSEFASSMWYQFPPLLADFDGDGRKDIAFPAISPDPDSNTAGFRILYQTSANKWKVGDFISADTYFEDRDWQPFEDVLGGDYNHDGKPDVALFATSFANTHPYSADLMLNTGSKPVGSCAAPAIGIHVCSPGASSGSPVKFSFSATSFYPLRKMEVWVDGVKKSETYHVFANQGFSDVSLALSAGKHTVSFFSGTYDGGVTKKTMTVTVP